MAVLHAQPWFIMARMPYAGVDAIAGVGVAGHPASTRSDRQRVTRNDQNGNRRE